MGFFRDPRFLAGYSGMWHLYRLMLSVKVMTERQRRVAGPADVENQHQNDTAMFLGGTVTGQWKAQRGFHESASIDSENVGIVDDIEEEHFSEKVFGEGADRALAHLMRGFLDPALLLGFGWFLHNLKPGWQYIVGVVESFSR